MSASDREVRRHADNVRYVAKELRDNLGGLGNHFWIQALIDAARYIDSTGPTPAQREKGVT